MLFGVLILGAGTVQARGNCRGAHLLEVATQLDLYLKKVILALTQRCSPVPLLAHNRLEVLVGFPGGLAAGPESMASESFLRSLLALFLKARKDVLASVTDILV